MEVFNSFFDSLKNTFCEQMEWTA